MAHDHAPHTGTHPADCDCNHCKTPAHDHHAMTREAMLEPRLHNMPHQHAFALVGHDTIFAVHMTQYYMEEHKYQVIFELGLPDDVLARLRKARRQNPKDWFILSNDDSDTFTIPDLASGRRATYRGQIFQGLPPFTDRDEAKPHFYPWSPDRCQPLIDGFEAQVKRIVMFRPFAHNAIQPDQATYLVFGKDHEAHMTNLQTGRLAGTRFDAPAYGPDYDHVMSLRERPAGFDDAQLECGITASLPALRLRPASHDGVERIGAENTVPAHWPFKPGQHLTMLYRGTLPAFTVIAGDSFLFGTAVSSSPETLRPDQAALDVSVTPDSLLKKH